MLLAKAGILEIIGEAANKLGEPYRLLHPEGSWCRIISARNVLIHASDQVLPHILEDAVERDMPALRSRFASFSGSIKDKPLSLP